MRRMLALFCILAAPLAAAEYKIAIVSGLHAHVWGPLKIALKGDKARLVGFAETLPELVAQAKKIGVPDNLIFSDYKKMIEETKPDMVWAFTETYRHLEVVEFCAPRGTSWTFREAAYWVNSTAPGIGTELLELTKAVQVCGSKEVPAVTFQA